MTTISTIILTMSFLAYAVLILKAAVLASTARKINPAITSIEFIKSKDPEIRKLFRRAGLLIIIGFGQFIFCVIVGIIINTLSGNFEW